MQRLFNISKWTRIPSGSALAFAGDRPRKVQLEVNTPGKVVLSLIEGTRSDFLAQVDGRDEIEFYVKGPFKITATGADCYVHTADGAGVKIESLDAESFAVVRERRPRNPELEYIAAVMSENMNRRLAHQAEELKRAFSRGTRDRPHEPADAGPGGGVSDELGEPEPEASGSDGDAAAPGGGKPRGRPRRG